MFSASKRESYINVFLPGTRPESLRVIVIIFTTLFSDTMPSVKYDPQSNRTKQRTRNGR